METPVARHINSHTHGGNSPIQNYIFTLIHEKSDSDEASEERNKWKNYWMARLYSFVLKGLNIKNWEF